MPTCLPPGWGSSGWGWNPWGGGGPLQQDLPVHPPFDVYCIGPCEEIAHYTQFFLVQWSAGLITDPLTGNLFFDSGGQGVPATEEWLQIDKAVPSVWTLEYTCLFHHLPPQLVSVMMGMGRVFVGVWNEQGGSCGLFFSASGIGYAARPEDPIIPIPNSSNIINETDYWTVRVVGSLTTGAIFVYITKSEDLDAGAGHYLRFILPLPTQAGSYAERTYVSVLGSAAIHNELELQGICLATGPVMPNMPPIADAGNEQEVKLCTIGQLDGSASYDPEAAPITYHWRLIDVPAASAYCDEGYDGWTEHDPSGFTNELHTRNNLDPLTGGWTVGPGDVLSVLGGAYTIQQVITTNPLDQIIRIDGYYLPSDDPTPHYFKIIRQAALHNHDTVAPTFYPDAPGFWKFDLVVFDGQLYSEPAVVVVSVRESPVPRGCTPDMSFIWNYMTDFWQLVEGKEPISTVWSAIAQIISAELMKLWQVDYNKSLRDIQRTMVRKWMYYDLAVQEPFFDLTRVPCLDVDDGYLTGTDGQVLPAQPPAPWPPLPLPLQMNPNGYRTNVQLDDKGIERGDLLVLYGNAYRIDRVVPEPSGGPPGLFRGELVLLDPIYDVPPVAPIPSLTTWSIVRPVTSSQIDFWGGLVVGGTSDVLGDDAFVEIIDKQTGAYQFVKCQVLGVCAQLPNGVALDPTDWSQYARDTTKRYELYFVSVFRRHYVPINDRIRDVPYLQQQIKDPPPDEVLQRNVDYFIERFRGRACIRFEDVWRYPVVDDTQDPPVTTWYDDPTPPLRLWGEFNHIENLSVVESNFGKLAGLTVDELAEVDAAMPGDIDYLSAVQGLWYVYFSAATPYSMRVGAQILLGLPFAEEDGSIVEIIPNLNVSATRLLALDDNDNGIVRAYDFPDGLDLEVNPATGLPYQVGDDLQQFAPISTGVDVIDYIKDPRWIEPYIGQGSLYEIQKYFYFPVIIESEAFTLAGALLTRKLMLNVKPSYTYPIIVVRFEPERVDIDVEEQMNMLVTLTIHEAPCTHYTHSHPHMWNAGDTGPVTFFPAPELGTSVPDDVWHRHENYPGWYSGWKSQYNIKDYPDVGYADFYESAPVVAFPYTMPTMPKPDGTVAAFWQLEPYDLALRAVHVEIEPNTLEPAPIYTLTLWHDGVAVDTHDFTITLLPGEQVFHLTIPIAIGVLAGDKPLEAVVTVGPGGSGTPDWAYVRATFYGIYQYVSPNWWGFYGGKHVQVWPPPPPAKPYAGGDMLCPEASLQLTTYHAWPVSAVVQYNDIFIFGEPVYPAYIDLTGPTPELVIDWSSPSLSVAPGSGLPGWSFGQTLDPPTLPYTGYVSTKFV